MRALLVLALAFALAFAGCASKAADKDDGGDPIQEQKLTDPVTGAQLPEIKVLAPLTSTVSLDGPVWVAPGSTVNFAAVAPANAKGTVTYTWMTGPLAGTVPLTQLNMNTHEIAAGESKTLTFPAAGLYRFHCHPHASFMATHNVTVVDGLAPSDVTVQIVDGPALSDYRYVPENVTVGKGSHVTYVNRGTMMHTATESIQTPPVKLIPNAKGATGSITFPADLTGWQMVAVSMADSEGRVGFANASVFVAPLPVLAPLNWTGTFTAGGNDQVSAPHTETFNLLYPAKIALNATAVTSVQGNALPAGIPAPDPAQIEIHVKEMGETQDSLTCAADSTCDQAAKLRNVTYQVIIKPVQGASITWNVAVTGVYDLVPPPQNVPYFDESKPHTH